MRIKVAYWNSRSGELNVLGSAETANDMGVLILEKLPDIAKSLSEGILYFNTNDKTIIPYKGNHLELATFLDNIFR